MGRIKVLTVGIAGALGIFMGKAKIDKGASTPESPQNSAKVEVKDISQDQLIQKLDVDRFQEQHGMLVATNHVT